MCEGGDESYIWLDSPFFSSNHSLRFSLIHGFFGAPAVDVAEFVLARSILRIIARRSGATGRGG